MTRSPKLHLLDASSLAPSRESVTREPPVAAPSSHPKSLSLSLSVSAGAVPHPSGHQDDRIEPLPSPSWFTDEAMSQR
jgi:hypothetical protein